jgi:hypothetical protein
MVYAQARKNESKREWRHPYILIAKGIKSPFSGCKVWPCLFLSNHHCCMCYHHQCSLHHVYVNRVNKHDVYQGAEVVYDDKDIHPSSSVVKEKVGDLPLNMCSILQNNSCNSILKCIMGYCMFIPTKTLKQMGT